MLSDQVKRHIVWVCAGCDKCEPLDGSHPQTYPCTDTSPSMDGAEVVLAEDYDRLAEAFAAATVRLTHPATGVEVEVNAEAALASVIRQRERMQQAIDVALSALDSSQYVGGPSEREAWRIVMEAIGPYRTEHIDAPDIAAPGKERTDVTAASGDRC